MVHCHVSSNESDNESDYETNIYKFKTDGSYYYEHTKGLKSDYVSNEDKSVTEWGTYTKDEGHPMGNCTYTVNITKTKKTSKYGSGDWTVNESNVNETKILNVKDGLLNGCNSDFLK